MTSLELGAVHALGVAHLHPDQIVQADTVTVNFAGCDVASVPEWMELMGKLGSATRMQVLVIRGIAHPTGAFLNALREHVPWSQITSLHVTGFRSPVPADSLVAWSEMMTQATAAMDVQFDPLPASTDFVQWVHLIKALLNGRTGTIHLGMGDAVWYDWVRLWNWQPDMPLSASKIQIDVCAQHDTRDTNNSQAFWGALAGSATVTTVQINCKLGITDGVFPPHPVQNQGARDYVVRVCYDAEATHRSPPFSLSNLVVGSQSAELTFVMEHDAFEGQIAQHFGDTVVALTDGPQLLKLCLDISQCDRDSYDAIGHDPVVQEVVDAMRPLANRRLPTVVTVLVHDTARKENMTRALMQIGYNTTVNVHSVPKAEPLCQSACISHMPAVTTCDQVVAWCLASMEWRGTRLQLGVETNLQTCANDETWAHELLGHLRWPGSFPVYLESEMVLHGLFPADEKACVFVASIKCNSRDGIWFAICYPAGTRDHVQWLLSTAKEDSALAGWFITDETKDVTWETGRLVTVNGVTSVVPGDKVPELGAALPRTTPSMPLGSKQLVAVKRMNTEPTTFVAIVRDKGVSSLYACWPTSNTDALNMCLAAFDIMS